MGRKYIGIELDEKYVKIAKDNVEGSKPTMVNGKYVSIYLNKIISVRDEDYDAINPYLKSIELKINGHSTKIMKLPLLKK